MIAIEEAGTGKPLVLLHGLGANRSIWARATPMLATRRRVLTPDIPGFGASTPVGRGFDLGQVAIALAEAVAKRTNQPFDLVGSSLGGAVALQLAFLRPELIRRLVLAAPAGFSPAPWPLALAAGRLLGPTLTLRRVVGVPLARVPVARRLLLWGAIAEPQRLSADNAVTMLRGSGGSTRVGSAVSTVLEADLSSVLADVDVPLGLIWGNRDRVIPISTLDSIRAIRPDAAVLTIDGAAHVPQLERPEEFVAVLRRVLKRLRRKRADHMSVRAGG